MIVSKPIPFAINVRPRTIPRLTKRKRGRSKTTLSFIGNQTIDFKNIKSKSFQATWKTLIKFWVEEYITSGNKFPDQRSIVEHLVRRHFLYPNFARTVAAIIRPPYARAHSKNAKPDSKDVLVYSLSPIFISTEFLALDEAYQHFWKDYRPPKNKATSKRIVSLVQKKKEVKPEAEKSVHSDDDVTYWLQSKYGMSLNMARCGAKLIRPDRAPRTVNSRIRPNAFKHASCIQPIVSGFLGSDGGSL
jgi:hypothetical protein